MHLLRFNEYSNQQSPLQRAKILGFNTDIIVYHGTMSEFEQFDKQKLGTFTLSASAKLGFFFGSSRKNSLHYAGSLHGGKAIVNEQKQMENEIKEKLLANGLENIFHMGYMGGMLIGKCPNVGLGATTQEIISAVKEDVAKSYNILLVRGKQYVNDVKNGKIDMDTYNEPEEDDDDDIPYVTREELVQQKQEQIELMRKSYEFILECLSSLTIEFTTRETIGDVKEFYLKLGRSFVVDHEGSRLGRPYADVISKAIEEGYDSVIFLNSEDPYPTDVYVVFEPNQIRSTQADFDLDKADSAILTA